MKGPFPDRVPALVVGAGPAGLAASRAMRRAGVDVLLVDARPVFGHPLRCGEMTNPGIFSEMGWEPRSQWVRNRLTAVGRIVLNRPRMERDMVGMLAAEGVHTVPGASIIGVGPFDGQSRTVTIAHKGERHRVRAECVIACDGVVSSVAHLAGLAPTPGLGTLYSCLLFRMKDMDLAREDAMFIAPLPPPYPFPPFYFWVIPDGGGGANVGLGLPARDGSRARVLLEKVLEMNRKQILKNPSRSGTGCVLETCTGFLPAEPPLEKPVADGLMVTGTAARLVDASSGAGIYAAAVSGRLAGNAFVNLNGREAREKHLRRYTNSIDSLRETVREGFDKVAPELERFFRETS